MREGKPHRVKGKKIPKAFCISGDYILHFLVLLLMAALYTLYIPMCEMYD